MARDSGNNKEGTREENDLPPLEDPPNTEIFHRGHTLYKNNKPHQ